MTDKRDDGGFPATRFEKVTAYDYEGREIDQAAEVIHPGDWFAGQALCGILASYDLADAMLRARRP